MKKCNHCGADLAKGASFCPYCATEQVVKEEVKIPKLWRKKTTQLGVVLVFIGILFFLISRYYEPKHYEGGADVIYTDADGTYQLALGLSGFDGVRKEGEPEKSVTLPPDTESAFPNQFYVSKEGSDELVWEEFLAKVQSCTVETIPQGAEKMYATKPEHHESFAHAALVSEIVYNSTCGTNVIRWSFVMKNGDTISLEQQVHVVEQNAVVYSADNASLESAEALQALLDRVNEEIPKDTVVYLYLPPVVYEEKIRLTDHTYEIYGGSNGDTITTFKETLTIGATGYQFSNIYGVKFEGNGGVGLNAYSSLALYGCTFSGWDTGAIAQSGGWIRVTDCVFEKNTIGLQLNTTRTSSKGHAYYGNKFIDNKTGLLISNLDSDSLLDLAGCEFSGNEIDIDNRIDYPIDTSEVIFH